MAFSLADMLKEVSNPDTGREQIEYIRLDLIDSDANNFYQLSDIDGLAENIAFAGLQQPIRVRRNADNERYTIISGHRRRAAIELLAKDEPEKWQEVSCIVQQDAGSPALQQLQLIFANSSTRKLTSAEISEQAVQVEKLLYKLKEEEGYEFPGRMRDHVSEVVGVSKSKLARLKVIREKLSSVWVSCFEENLLTESAAYELAQLPDAWQSVIYGQWGVHPGSLYADDVKTYKKRFERVVGIQCQHGLNFCEHSVTMMEQNVKDKYMTKCDKCCFDCGYLQGCGKCCPEAKARKVELKQNAKKASEEAAAREAKRQQPYVDMAKLVYERVGIARSENRVSVKKLFEAQKRFYSSDVDDKRQRDYELGKGTFTDNMDLPFGYSVRVSLLITICNVADALGCSVDYLLGRTDQMKLVSGSDAEEKEPVFIPGAWYAASVEPPVGEKLILMDSGGYVDTGKYKGCGEYDMDYGDPVVLWTPMPEEKDVVTSLPVSYGWNTGNPEAYGTYVAYVFVDGAAKPIIRELLWDGECWYLHGDQIHDDVTVQCWAERPEL